MDGEGFLLSLHLIKTSVTKLIRTSFYITLAISLSGTFPSTSTLQTEAWMHGFQEDTIQSIAGLSFLSESVNESSSRRISRGRPKGGAGVSLLLLLGIQSGIKMHTQNLPIRWYLPV